MILRKMSVTARVCLLAASSTALVHYTLQETHLRVLRLVHITQVITQAARRLPPGRTPHAAARREIDSARPAPAS